MGNELELENQVQNRKYHTYNEEYRSIGVKDVDDPAYHCPEAKDHGQGFQFQYVRCNGGDCGKCSEEENETYPVG